MSATKSLPPVEYHRLGKSGLRVSCPIVGAMSYGTSNWEKWVMDEDKALEVLKAAWDRGINTIDTANAYSNGSSEMITGNFIKGFNIPREKILIFTKCFFIVNDNPLAVRGNPPSMADTRDYVNQSGLSRAAIFNQVEASLRRLQTPYIDLLQIHRFDPNTPIEETMKALHDLVQSGKVRYIGASSMRVWQFAEFQHVAEKNGWTKFISMQNEYSLLYREEEREMIPYCNANGIGLIPWGPLQDGNLARPLAEESVRKQTVRGTVFERKHSEEDKAVINRVEELAKKKGWTMAQVSLAWVKKRVSSPIVGMSSVDRVESNIITGLELTEEEEKYLEEPYVPKAVRGHA